MTELNGKKMASAMERVSDETYEKVREQMVSNDLSASEAIAIVNKQDPEKKKYLVLYYGSDGHEEEKGWEIITGRTEAYNFIKNRAEILDIHNSIVVAGTVTLLEALESGMNVYEFMKHMRQYFNDGFDIEDYNIGDNNKEE